MIKSEKEQLMEVLHISEDELKYKMPLILEKCFCLAIMQQENTNIMAELLNDYLKFKQILLES